MYVHVKLLKGYSEPLLYAVPDSWETKPTVGSLVHVPIRTQTSSALVIELLDKKPAQATYMVKQLVRIEAFPSDHYYHNFVQHLGNYYQTDPLHFIKRIRQFIAQKEVVTPDQEIDIAQEAITRPIINLTGDQENICNFLMPKIITPCYTPTLLHGVTGSGKTEVYKKLITHTIEHKKTVLLLLPEVTLALQFERILRAQLSESIPIFAFHSAVSTKNKRLLWQHILDNKPIVILGVHLPILLPISNLGLIIIDEEHETGYQEKKHPKINTKDTAIWRAHAAQIPILFGSATPSISSLYNVKVKNWHFFQLKERFAGAFPLVKTVLLSDKKKRKNFWISPVLEQEIKDRLRKKEQTIIFLNRRGYSFFVQCKNCSFIFSCPNCSVSLTLHSNNRLSCHYCNYTQILATTCPECKAPEKDFLKKGIGTQQVVTILEKLFPQAIIGRADLDTTTKKNEWRKTVLDFEQGHIDILVGTQTITKGYHFPNVTLVGILWADLNLNFPVFNASETTLQQLIQVAGRAGRQRTESTVIVQAMGEHPVFNYLNERDYLRFYENEILLREELGYPPIDRLVEIN